MWEDHFLDDAFFERQDLHTKGLLVRHTIVLSIKVDFGGMCKADGRYNVLYRIAVHAKFQYLPYFLAQSAININIKSQLIGIVCQI